MAQMTLATPSSAAVQIAAAASSRLGWSSQLMDALAEGAESPALHVLGDSTGYTAGKTRWVDLLGTWLASQYPAYGVNVARFNDATQLYDQLTTVQAQPSGARYAAIAGASLSHGGDGTTLSGKFECEIDVSFNNPANNVLSSLIYRAGGTAGTKQFGWYMKPSQMVFEVSSDGTNWLTAYTSTVAPFYPAAGTRVRYRVQFNPNTDGTHSAASFYYSTDGGTTWTQIGATWTNTFTVAANTANLPGYEAGGRQGTVETLDGRIYGAWVRNGWSSDSPPGVSVVPRSPDNWASSAAPITYGGSPVVTIVNGSVPGKGILYFNASAARVLAMTPTEYSSRALVLNNSHNDTADANNNTTSMTGAYYTSLWDSWLTNLRARFPDIPIAVTIQNHRQPPANYVEAHRARGRALRAWARKNGCDVIDVRRAWQDAMNAGTYTLTQLVDQTDGQYIHPSDTAGSPLWAQTVEGHLTARV